MGKKKIGIKWKASMMPSQEGKRVVVTGSNSGIGFEMAMALAGHGAHVIMACRNSEKADVAKVRILEAHPQAQVTVEIVDLAELKSIHAFTERLRNADQPLDILINNAGVMIPPASTTADGFELQIGTNHIGHFALTAGLLPLLERAAAGRIVTVSSIAHWAGRIDFEDLNGRQKKYNKWGMYSQSKLANLLFALELDRRLKAAGSSVESFASHPGYSNTQLQRHSLLWRILNVGFAVAPSKGAAPTLYAATEADARSHRYWGLVGPMEAWGWTGRANITPHAADETTAKRLWALTEELSGVPFLSG